MSASALKFANDEELFLRAPADFALLAPPDGRLAWGGDGGFAPPDRWRLHSGLIDFAAQGVEPGQVVQLLGPAGAFGPAGEVLVVESVAGHAIELRRPGLGAGVGQPPGPAGGLAGVEFLIVTFGPRFARAADELERRFGPAEPDALREAVLLTVLHRQYLALSRHAEPDSDGLASKAWVIRSELDERLARLVTGRPGDPAGSGPAFFQTRITR